MLFSCELITWMKQHKTNEPHLTFEAVVYNGQDQIRDKVDS